MLNQKCKRPNRASKKKAVRIYVEEVNGEEKANKIKSNRLHTSERLFTVSFVWKNMIYVYVYSIFPSLAMVSVKIMKSTKTEEKLADYTESNVKFTQLLPAYFFFFLFFCC